MYGLFIPTDFGLLFVYIFSTMLWLPSYDEGRVYR